MANPPRHLAFNADEVSRATHLCQEVLGWKFHAWGPPGFFKLDEHGLGVVGVAPDRLELRAGAHGAEGPVVVDDLEAVTRAVRARGGRILMDKTSIPGVGDLVFFADSAGNVAGAMRYYVG